MQHHLCHPAADGVVLPQHRDGIPRPDLAAGDAADRQPAGVIVPAEVGDQCLEAALFEYRRRHVAQDRLKQRHQAVGHGLGL